MITFLFTLPVKILIRPQNLLVKSAEYFTTKINMIRKCILWVEEANPSLPLHTSDPSKVYFQYYVL